MLGVAFQKSRLKIQAWRSEQLHMTVLDLFQFMRALSHISSTHISSTLVKPCKFPEHEQIILGMNNNSSFTPYKSMTN